MKPKLDFLRLATWNTSEHALLISHMLANIPGKWERGGWLQYKGWKNEGLFVGRGEQRGTRHGILNQSGFRSDDIYEALFDWKSLYCTRLDIQVTIAQPENVMLDEVYARIRNHVKSSLIQSDQNDTLYVGARTSEIFTRLYEKILDQKYLRLEFELKGLRARGAWQALHDGMSKPHLFDYYLKRVKLPGDIKDLFRLDVNDQTEYAMRGEIDKDDQNTLKWLQSIDSAMMKALANHAIGEQVKTMVDGWSAFSDNLDKKRAED